jgi:hypothetical protein
MDYDVFNALRIYLYIPQNVKTLLYQGFRPFGDYPQMGVFYINIFTNGVFVQVTRQRFTQSTVCIFCDVSVNIHRIPEIHL